MSTESHIRPGARAANLGEKSPGNEAKADRNDLITGILVGALAIGFLIYDGIRRVAALFAGAGAVTVDAPVPAQEITVGVGSGAPATVTAATLVATDVNLVSVVCLVLSVVVGTLGLITVAVLGVLLCLRLLRGAVFDAVNVRLMFAVSITLLVAALGGVWFRNMGLNGVFAALGGEFDDHGLLFLQSVPILAAAFATGVLVIVFRRGVRLQRDTEGLV